MYSNDNDCYRAYIYLSLPPFWSSRAFYPIGWWSDSLRADFPALRRDPLDLTPLADGVGVNAGALGDIIVFPGLTGPLIFTRFDGRSRTKHIRDYHNLTYISKILVFLQKKSRDTYQQFLYTYARHRVTFIKSYHLCLTI